MSQTMLSIGDEPRFLAPSFCPWLTSLKDAIASLRHPGSGNAISDILWNASWFNSGRNVQETKF